VCVRERERANGFSTHRSGCGRVEAERVVEDFVVGTSACVRRGWLCGCVV
jgi:hypothetical protein